MTTVSGNVLSVPHGIVVHGCNAKGVMGSGIARQIRDTYPDVYADYMRAHRADGLKVGSVVWSAPKANRPFWVANAITQEAYGRDPRVRYVSYEGVRSCFADIAQKARAQNLEVHYPQIGAGLGNGEWGTLSSIISEQLGDIPHTLWLYEPTAQSRPPRR